MPTNNIAHARKRLHQIPDRSATTSATKKRPKLLLCRVYWARDIVSSISSADIDSASLQQKAVSSGILLDKSLLLSGDATSINVSVLMDVVEALRSRPPLRVELPSQSLALP